MAPSMHATHQHSINKMKLLICLVNFMSGFAVMGMSLCILYHVHACTFVHCHARACMNLSLLPFSSPLLPLLFHGPLAYFYLIPGYFNIYSI